jgi:hypothetical protein
MIWWDTTPPTMKTLKIVRKTTRKLNKRYEEVLSWLLCWSGPVGEGVGSDDELSVSVPSPERVVKDMAVG